MHSLILCQISVIKNSLFAVCQIVRLSLQPWMMFVLFWHCWRLGRMLVPCFISVLDVAGDWPEGRGHRSALSNSKGRGRLIIHVPQGIKKGICVVIPVSMQAQSLGPKVIWAQVMRYNFGPLGILRSWQIIFRNGCDHYLQLFGCASDGQMWDTFFGQSLAILILFPSTAFLGESRLGTWMLKCGCLDFYFLVLSRRKTINCGWIPSSPVPFSCALLDHWSCLQNHLCLPSPGIGHSRAMSSLNWHPFSKVEIERHIGCRGSPSYLTSVFEHRMTLLIGSLLWSPLNMKTHWIMILRPSLLQGHWNQWCHKALFWFCQPYRLYEAMKLWQICSMYPDRQFAG